MIEFSYPTGSSADRETRQPGILAVGIAFAVFGCGIPTPTDQGNRAVVSSTESDGIRLTLGVDRGTMPAGETLHATVTIANIGTDAAFWDSSCGLVGGLAIDGPAPKPQDPGKVWTGIPALIKMSAIGDGPTQTGFVPPFVPAGTRFGCNFAGSDQKELRPGASEHEDAVWYGRTSDLLPAPAGSYVIRSGLLFRGRAGEGGPLADAVPIRAQAPVVVTGGDFQGLSAAAALDAALSDPIVAKWVGTELPGGKLSGASMRFGDDKMWHLQINKQDPATTQIVSSATIVVDPGSGRIVSRHIPT